MKKNLPGLKFIDKKMLVFKYESESGCITIERKDVSFKDGMLEKLTDYHFHIGQFNEIYYDAHELLVRAAPALNPTVWYVNSTA